MSIAIAAETVFVETPEFADVRRVKQYHGDRAAGIEDAEWRMLAERQTVRIAGRYVVLDGARSLHRVGEQLTRASIALSDCSAFDSAKLSRNVGSSAQAGTISEPAGLTT